MSLRPFCEIVKSAAPTFSTPAAVVRMLSVTIPRATTTSTPTATAAAVSMDRTFLDHTLWPISQMNDMGDSSSRSRSGARATAPSAGPSPSVPRVNAP